MSRVSLLVALLSALFFVILISELVQSSSASSSSPMLPSDRLARYLHLQKALEGKKRKRAYLPDARSFIHRTTAKRSANEHEILHAHDDHVHTDSHSKCTSAEHESRMREKYPELGTKEDFELLLREKMLARRERMSKRAVVTPPVTVAVVVIVIHEGEAEGTGSNIGLDQIESQFVVLNQDFNTTGGSGVDCQMSFKLEKVVRVDYHSRGWAAPPYNDTYFDQVIKPVTSQDPNNFLNIWVTDLDGTTLGYAQFPSLSGLDGLDQNGGDEATDGVVIRNTAFGTIGSVTAPYNGGRTTTHEVGHFFGLRHIWGDGAKGQCATDYCQDTPPADQPNYHCPSPAPTNCGGTNQIQNYMDYTDDACMDRFMSCQKERMITVLENSPRRGGLIVIGNGNLTYDVSLKIVEPEDGAICYNFDSSITPVFSVSNLGFETIYNATISIQFDGGALSTQNFEFPGGLDQNETVSVSWAMPVDLTALSEDSHAFVATIAGLNGGGSQDEDPFSDTDAVVFYLSKNRSETYEMDYEGLSDFPPAGWVVVNGGWDAVDDVPGADGENGISAVSPMYELDRIGTGYEMLYYAGFKVGADGSTLTFDIAYAPFTNGTHVATGDRLLIYIGTQCSDYVQLFYQKDALALRTVDPTTDSYVPTSRFDWRTETVVISDSFLFGRAAVINFVTVTGGGNNLWIDNIRVTAGQNSAASGLSSWLSLSQ